jgi:hypothetical protein
VSSLGVGSLACYVDDDGDAVLACTWDDLGTVTVVEQRGGVEGSSALRHRWVGSADRDLRGPTLIP